MAGPTATILGGDFVPLSERTLEARARRRNPDSGKLSKAATSKNARLELKRRAEGLSASTTFARPLYDKGGQGGSTNNLCIVDTKAGKLA